MSPPVNPYVAGNPVGDSPAFVGRADVLHEVLRVLRRPQDNAIVLFGQRRIGKTSILQHLAAQLPREGPYRAVYFDLQDKADWRLDRVLRELARTVAYALDQPDPDLGDNPETAFRDELVRTVRDDTSFREWVRRYELGFLLTRGEKERFGKAAIAVGDLLRESADKLVEGAAKGAGEAIGKAVVGGG
jgi:hypothetical protein